MNMCTLIHSHVHVAKFIYMRNYFENLLPQLVVVSGVLAIAGVFVLVVVVLNVAGLRLNGS